MKTSWTAIAYMAAVALTAARVDAAETCVPTCVEIYKPVCGSDGQTYENQCSFDYKKCSTSDASLTVVAEGECKPSSGSGSGACEKGCTKIMKPVCGSDGKTYNNECELTNAKCKMATLTKKADGECGSSTGSGSDACAGTMCPMDYTPVCGSDGTTYSNECTLKVAQCMNPSLTLASTGECKSPTNKSGSVGAEDEGSGSAPSDSASVSPAPATSVPTPAPDSEAGATAFHVASLALAATAVFLN